MSCVHDRYMYYVHILMLIEFVQYGSVRTCTCTCTYVSGCRGSSNLKLGGRDCHVSQTLLVLGYMRAHCVTKTVNEFASLYKLCINMYLPQCIQCTCKFICLHMQLRVNYTSLYLASEYLCLLLS